MVFRQILQNFSYNNFHIRFLFFLKFSQYFGPRHWWVLPFVWGYLQGFNLAVLRSTAALLCHPCDLSGTCVIRSTTLFFSTRSKLALLTRFFQCAAKSFLSVWGFNLERVSPKPFALLITSSVRGILQVIFAWICIGFICVSREN